MQRAVHRNSKLEPTGFHADEIPAETPVNFSFKENYKHYERSSYGRILRWVAVFATVAGFAVNTSLFLDGTYSQPSVFEDDHRSSLLLRTQSATIEVQQQPRVHDTQQKRRKLQKNQEDEQQQQKQPEQKQEQKQQEPVKAKRTKTDVGVDVSDPELYAAVDLKGDSSTSTVMGMAAGYKIDVFQRFVGSLRATGYKGHIILGVVPEVSQEILDYLANEGVTAKILKKVDCTYKDEDAHLGKVSGGGAGCFDPYPDIKARWSRFPLQRDWLEECKTCTGPVLIMDVRDSLFQLDPFGEGSPVVKGLQVFEEEKSQTTAHWLTSTPFSNCKGVKPPAMRNYTMLCSGTTIGTRTAMLKYLEVMHAEMKDWIVKLECRWDRDGDDQSMHNWLFYTGQLPFATAIPNRQGGIVNTVGVLGSNIRKEHFEQSTKSYPGATGKRWIGKEFTVCDDEGRFIEMDGSVSRVVHQYDRFGRHMQSKMIELLNIQ